MTQATLHINTGKKDPITGVIIENWLVADLTVGATINLRDSIKDSKDVGKVFTVYTNPFSMPASKTNNQIFKRFSNNKVYEGFDPRRKYDARIKLNGVDFKKGYIKLNKVNLINNEPASYSVQFFGELSSLKDILSNSKLKDLYPLAKYTFPYTYENVRMGMESGFDVIVNDDAGLKHASMIQVEASPTSSGTCTVTLNGNAYNLQITGGQSIEGTTEQLALLINQIDGYGTGVTNGNRVIIVSDENGPESAIGFAYGSCVGMLVTLFTLQIGNNDPQSTAEVTVLENPYGDFKFPLLSHTRGFEYSDADGFHRMLTTSEKNGEYTVESSDRLNRYDLKPAIKISKIFEAISEMYPSIRFDTSWLFGGNGIEASVLDEMYLWLHNKKGYIGYTDAEGNNVKYTHERILRFNGAGIEEGEWVYSSVASPDPDARPFEHPTAVPRVWRGVLRVEDMEGSGDVQLQVKVWRVGVSTPLLTFDTEGSADDGMIEQEFYFPSYTVSQWTDPNDVFYVETKIIADSSVIQMRPFVRIDKATFANTFIEQSYYYDRCSSCSEPPTVEILPNLSPNLLMPDYKTIDFLTDLFKMYNLVAFEEIQFDNTYKINIQSYDYYINSGTEYDITKWIDISKSTVERVTPYSVIQYAFAKPKTFLAINQKEITGDDFGNVDFNVSNFQEGGQSSNSLLFDGGTYKVKPKLEKMMYERLNAYPSNDLIPIQWGWFVNDNKENVPEPAIGKPLFMFCNRNYSGIPSSGSTFPIKWSDDVESVYYNAPSNVSQNKGQTLHFNAEFDEWSRATNENSLFENFHSNFINSIYSPYAKRIKVEAYLPPLIFNKLRLNDTIIVDNISYFIDKMEINITTSKTKLSLLRVTDITTRLKGSEEGTINWEDEAADWDVETKNWDIK